MARRFSLLGIVAAILVGMSLMVSAPTATAVAMQPAAQPASPAKSPTQGEAESWVKKVNESVKTGCSVIKASGAATTLAALKTKNSKLATLAAVLTAAGAACDETTKIIDKITGSPDEKAKQKAAKDAEDKLAALTKQVTLLDEVKERTKQVGEIDLGVVDAARKEYSASPQDIVKDKKAAIAKWKALAGALKLNVGRLEERQKFLKDVSDQCDKLTPKLTALKKKVEGFRANDKGVCESIECLQNLKLQALLDELPKLKQAAQGKLKELEPVLKDESNRHKNLKANLKDLFGESVD